MPQTELTASRRRANVQAAFSLAPRYLRTDSRLRNATLVLVDDVVTTGATLEACAHTLRRNGVREVMALTLARAVR